MALVLLTLLGLTAGVAAGVVLTRRALKKRKHPEGNGETQERSGIVELGGATEEEEVHTYAVVGIHTSIDGRVVLYQGLDVGSRDWTGAGPQGQRGGAPLPEAPHQQGDRGIWKKGVCGLGWTLRESDVLLLLLLLLL